MSEIISKEGKMKKALYPSLLLTTLSVYAQPAIITQLNKHDVYLTGKEGQYKSIVTLMKTATNRRGVNILQTGADFFPNPASTPEFLPGEVTPDSSITVTYYPKTQSMKLLDAYVIRKNGTKIHLSADDVNIGQGNLSPLAPGFNNQKIFRVAWPDLLPGDTVFAKYQFEQIAPTVNTYNNAFQNDSTSGSVLSFEPVKKMDITVHAPKDMYLKWAKKGPFQVSDAVNGDERVIHATAENLPALGAEPYMLSAFVYQPYFQVTTLKTWADFGNQWWPKAAYTMEVTPLVRETARRIVGDKKGFAAVNAIYNFVNLRIYYVALLLNQKNGNIPQTATQILQNGFGDCKDHATLLVTLLKAIGVKAYPTLIAWSGNVNPYKLPFSYFDHFIAYIPKYHLFANPTNTTEALGQLDPAIAGHFVIVQKPNNQSYATYVPKNDPKTRRYMALSHEKISRVVDKAGHQRFMVKGISKLSYAGGINNFLRREIANYNESDIGAMAGSDMGNVQSPTVHMQVKNLNKIDKPLILKAKWQGDLAESNSDIVSFSIPSGLDTYWQTLPTWYMPGERKFGFWYGNGNLNWHFLLHAPAGYHFTHVLPVDQSIDNSAGHYTSRYRLSDDSKTLLANRQLLIKQDIYFPEQYYQFRDLVKVAVNDRKSTAILAKD